MTAAATIYSRIMLARENFYREQGEYPSMLHFGPDDRREFLGFLMDPAALTFPSFAELLRSNPNKNWWFHRNMNNVDGIIFAGMECRGIDEPGVAVS